MFDINPFTDPFDNDTPQDVQGRPRRQTNDIDTLFTATTGVIQRVSDLEKRITELETKLGFMAEIVTQTREALSPMEHYALDLHPEYNE